MLLGLPSVLAFSTLKWLQRLGGPGLILLGLADNSVVPLPGSMDVLTIVGVVAAHYGSAIFRFFSQYYRPALYLLIALAVAGGIAGVFFYLRHRKKAQKKQPVAPAKPKAAKRKIA